MPDAVYPGSFDPLHNGHMDVVKRAAELFDRLLVGVYETPPKDVLFSTEERVELFDSSVAHLGNVEVAPFNGLVTDLAREVGAKYVVRGLRAGFDFESEFEMALMWRHLDPDIDIVCMMSRPRVPVRLFEPHQRGGPARRPTSGTWCPNRWRTGWQRS